MAREFKSFYKTVQGGEGDRCNYPTRLDTYGCGCANNCAYCYARSLLDFRGMWHPDSPSITRPSSIRKTIDGSIKGGKVVRLGGMTDCFQQCEKELKVTYNAIKQLNRACVRYLIVTKNPLVASDEYMKILDKRLAHIQVSITATDDDLNKSFEDAEPFTKRVEAIERLHRAGFDVSVRLSPFIPQFIDYDRLNAIKCDKILIEFLRVNHFVRRHLDIDYSEYTHREGNYRHLPLRRKIELLQPITGFKEHTVCDDVQSHYEWFRDNYNANPNDCCNLAIQRGSW